MKLSGKHLIAGDWIGTDEQFLSDPATGEALSFSHGTSDLVDQAVQAAEEAFWTFGYSEAKDRAAFLTAIADEIEARADTITEIGSAETGLPHARLQGERGRTTGQLRMFAAHILDGSHLNDQHDPALSDRAPMPRPDLQLTKRPIGPVAVFGASNFPLAFSTAGGDTASALAAGCPVVLRGHSAHPGTAEIIADAIHAAIRSCGVHPGVFSLIQGGGFELGTALVQHPLINAVGFTGSFRGGRALFDLCAQRPEPIPFFGELGSINPMFLMPSAVASRGSDIATGWAGSLTMGAGQFCTNPGVIVLVDGPEAEAFQVTAREALKAQGPQTMLTKGIAAAYVQGRKEIAEAEGVTTLLTTSAPDDRSATPAMFVTSGEEWLANDQLGEEVFGPLGVIVRVANIDEMHAVAKGLKGQLTCTVHHDSADQDAVAAILPILERKAGRLLANGFPTGVEVCDAMMHGGPYPASTTFGTTSVGTQAIQRWLRLVCYQDLQDFLR